MALVALLSNPRSSGNLSQLPRVRSFCANEKDIFHYEVEEVGQIAQAMRTIARVRPKVIVLNGGDGTVQAALTELHQGGHFCGSPPPVAVLPNGKTNLIAQDLGANGDPITALERVLELARTDMAPHIVERELIALSDGKGGERPVLGMFLGGAGLADTMLYCRHKIYPLGLPNWLAHGLTLVLSLAGVLTGRDARFLPPVSRELTVSVTRSGVKQGRFSLLMVTTLQRLLFNGSLVPAGMPGGSMQMLLIDRSFPALMRAFAAGMSGRLGRRALAGVHLERSDEIRIEGARSSVILDGETFEADTGRPIVLRPTAPVPFLRLAA
ncbi:diacylglycerol/lipid kinase family protein [Sphingosinicella sp.]|uniref:diacylglycerol/lipid kinase family protein n=1 Tax=Sphingosinicella sp. TaxID=1917971 RepID=UPI0040380B51